MLVGHLGQLGCHLLWSVSTALGNMINKLEFSYRTHVTAFCLARHGLKQEEDAHLSLVYDNTLFAWTKREVEVSYLNSFILVKILKLNQEQPYYNFDGNSFAAIFFTCRIMNVSSHSGKTKKIQILIKFCIKLYHSFSQSNLDWKELSSAA